MSQWEAWKRICLRFYLWCSNFAKHTVSNVHVVVCVSRAWICAWSTPTASATTEKEATTTSTLPLTVWSTWDTFCLQSSSIASTDLKWRTKLDETDKHKKSCQQCSICWFNMKWNWLYANYGSLNHFKLGLVLDMFLGYKIAFFKKRLFLRKCIT